MRIQSVKHVSFLAKVPNVLSCPIVKITLNGDGEIENIFISDNLLKDDKSLLEDLIIAAHNNAKNNLKSKTSDELSKVTGGFGIPGFKWPL